MAENTAVAMCEACGGPIEKGETVVALENTKEMWIGGDKVTVPEWRYAHVGHEQEAIDTGWRAIFTGRFEDAQAALATRRGA